MSGPMTMDQIVDRLKKCTKSLLILNSSTEDDFLTIGAQLRDVSTKAGEISSTATSAAGLINGEELKRDVGSLQELFTQMERYLKSSDMELVRSAETLRTILTEVEKALGPLVAFKKIVKHLRMLAISTKIESARLLTGDGSFSTIADDVEKLSTLIDSKSAGILAAITSLRHAIGETLLRMGALEKRERGQAHTMGDRIASGLKSLSEAYALSSSTAYRIAHVSDEIGSSIGEIVSSLQFHDITRQQIEHVLEAIGELEQELSAVKESHDARERAGELYVSDVCGLQVGQLQNAKNELVNAVDHILRDLRSIGQNGKAISKELGTLIGISGSQDRSFLVRLKADVSGIISSLQENTEASLELSTAVGGVSRTIEDLSRFVGDIEDVGMEIELIALNARVRAAKTGEEGAALGVLAEGVRNLSDNSRDQTTAISETLTHVTDIAKSLGGGQEEADGEARDHEPREEASADHMVDELNELILSFGDMDTRVASLIEHMEEASASLASRINELTSGVTAHEQTERVLSGVIADIEGVARLAAELEPYAGGAEAKEAYLKRFEERYTMHRERYVHNSRILPGGSQAPHDDDAAETLGENVEFF
jgi:hypothetical protein